MGFVRKLGRAPRGALERDLEKALEEHYELKRGGRLGPGPEDDEEATVLNRVVRWTEQGLEYEADPRQVEKLLEALDLEDAKKIATPGVKPLPSSSYRTPLCRQNNTRPLGHWGLGAIIWRQIDQISSSRLRRSAAGFLTPPS